MRFRTPNQLHASLYMEEDVRTGRRGSDAGARRNTKTAKAHKAAGAKNGGKKK